MCGIVVNYSKNNSISKELLQKALKTIHHRGPDESSVWISKDGTTALGHVRLSILDVSNGAQPYFSENKKIAAVINGEFYDFEKIKKELELKGHKFKTNCDSEILIPLYQEYGASCLEYLRGEFSFVLLDLEKNIIFSARDRFGIKPLYYHIKNNQLFIASEIKSILALGVPPVWNPDTVYLSNHSIYQQERTCFKDIFLIKPGHTLTYNLKYGTLEQKKYWDLDYHQPKLSGLGEAEYIETFRNKILDAVNVRLRSDVSYACYLSGGLDSTAVLALAAELSTTPPDAFTIAFPGKATDEFELARKTAEFVGANHYHVDVSEQDIVDALPDSIWHGESLVCNTHGVGLFLLSKLVNKIGHKVILTGGGADEMFYGYEFFREDAIKYNVMGYSEHKQQAMLSALRNASIAPGMTVSMTGNSGIHNDFERLYGCVPALVSIYMSRIKQFSKYYRASFLSENKNKNAIDMLVNDISLKEQQGIGVLDLDSYLFVKSSLPGYILSSIGDKVEMAHSIEGRIPFLDHKVSEYVQNLPPQMKIKDDVEKYILRESTKDILPPWIYNRTKQPFFAPESSGTLYNYMGEVFNSDLLKYSPFYNQASVLELYSRYSSLDSKSKISTDYVLTEILSSCLLQQQFNMQSYE